LFSKGGKPMYVGQTRKLRDRLPAHTIPSATHHQASFAFLLAKADVKRRSLQITGTRKQIAAHADFIPAFKKAKQRVADMDVRFIEVPEAALRTVFEVYAALALGTGEFNSFETH